MALATVTDIITGLLNANSFPFTFAQLYDTVICTNGRDANRAYHSRTGTGSELGITAPTNSPVMTVGYVAGVLNGTYLYRYRWVDALRGKTYSNACTPFTATPATQNVQLTLNEIPPARATHFIIERTEVNGTKFYSVNVSTSLPFGNPVASTSYIDSTTDVVLAQQFSTNNCYGVPKPYLFCFANLAQIFMGGCAPYRTQVTLTNGSPTVTGTNFVASDAGRDLTVKATTSSYQILTRDSATQLTLTANFSGATGTYDVSIANQGNVAIVCEPAQPEGYGLARVSPYSNLSNEFTIGTDVNYLTAGIGLGAQGVLWAKQNQLFYHTYSINPLSIQGDARITQLPTFRGALNPKCLEFAEGIVYGIDTYGFWRMSPGGLPEDISVKISNDFKAQIIKLKFYYNFFIKYDPYTRTVNFFVIFDNHNVEYPNYAYRWSIDEEKWIDSEPYDIIQTNAVVLPDQFGVRRLVTFNKGDGAGLKTYSWFHGIGYTYGAIPTASPLIGTATGGTISTIVKTGASFPTTNGALESVPVIRIRGEETATYTLETSIVISNTADTLTVSPAFSDATAVNDKFVLGPIKSKYRTGRISIDKLAGKGSPEKINSLVLWLWLRYQGSAANIYVAVYTDGNYQKTDSVWKISDIISGVQTVANRDFATVDSTVDGINIFQIPLGMPNKDIQIELFSYDSSEPWSVLNAKLEIGFYGDERPQV